MKNYVNNNIWEWSKFPLLMLSLLLAVSCTKGEFPENIISEELFFVNEQSVSLSSKAQYYALQVSKKAENLNVKIESNADWLKVCCDTLTEDGWFEVLVVEDDEEVERSAMLTITGTDGTRTQTSVCKIVQGEDQGYNGYNIEATKTMRVGYGYDIFGNYMNDLSVKASILNQDILAATNDNYGLVETHSRSVLDIEKNTSRNLVELATLLTKKQETETTNIKGCKKTVKESSNSSYEAEDNQYVYIRYYKTTGMRSLDYGVLTKMIDEGKDVFDSDFSKLRNEIISNPNDQEKIVKMINKFGTHLVVKGELGAAIEVTATFDMKMTGELNLRAEDFANYFFKGENSSYVLANGKVKDMTSTITTDVNCHIYGGSEETRRDLKNDINTNGRISETKLSSWLDSSSGIIDNNETAKAIVPINFRLMPIWNLFPIECVESIVNVVNRLADNSVNRISDSQIGSDYYKLDLTNDLLSFETSNEYTQVKVLYAKNTNNGMYSPILEICNEYVPDIRGDKRIPVVYGIKNGSPFMGAGFFTGDGEGNPPAWLTFSEGECYVQPLSGYENNDKLTTIFYLHGNIYETDYGMDCSTPKFTKVENQYLQFFGSENKYPIAKIGHGYWTRCNIKDEMMFGEPMDASDKYSEYYIYETLRPKDDMLFANFFDGNQYDFLEVNPMYGETEDKWHIPTLSDSDFLKQYLGNNLKNILKDQTSGFDAQYAGCYVRFDIMNKNRDMGSYQYLYDGEYCFLPFKNTSTQGRVFVLDKNYDLRIIDVDYTREGFYPIRLFRSSKYKYNDIN